MGLAEQFTNLGENLLGSFDARVNFLGQNIVDTHKYLDTCRKDHKAMAKELKAKLRADEKERLAQAKKDAAGRRDFVGALVDDVAGFRKRVKKENKELFTDVHHFLGECRREGQKAHQAWQRVTKTMAAKRKNFKGALTGAKQKAGRAH